jgi:hypothetical protein
VVLVMDHPVSEIEDEIFENSKMRCEKTYKDDKEDDHIINILFLENHSINIQ